MLNGARLLVVGGSSGIGLAVAIQAAAAGTRATVASRSADRLAAAAEIIGEGAAAVTADVTEQPSVAQLTEQVGVVDHLVVTASDVRAGGIRDVDTDQAQGWMEAKLWGAYRLVRAVALAPSGSITLVSGDLSRRPAWSGSAALSAVNAAVEALGRSLALELAPVRVNIVSPGVTDTPLWARMSAEVRDRVSSYSQTVCPTVASGATASVNQARACSNTTRGVSCDAISM